MGQGERLRREPVNKDFRGRGGDSESDLIILEGPWANLTGNRGSMPFFDLVLVIDFFPSRAFLKCLLK